MGATWALDPGCLTEPWPRACHTGLPSGGLSARAWVCWLMVPSEDQPTVSVGTPLAADETLSPLAKEVLPANRSGGATSCGGCAAGVKRHQPSRQGYWPRMVNISRHK